jgi:hypothetical protein
MRAEGPTKEAGALNGSSSVDDQADDAYKEPSFAGGGGDTSRMSSATTPKNAPRDRGPTYEFSLGSVDTFERKLELAQARLQVPFERCSFFLPTPPPLIPLSHCHDTESVVLSLSRVKIIGSAVVVYFLLTHESGAYTLL